MITEAEIEVAAMLRELHRCGDAIRQSEMVRLRKRMCALTTQKEQALDGVTSAIVRRILLLSGAGLEPDLGRNGDAERLRALLGLEAPAPVGS